MRVLPLPKPLPEEPGRKLVWQSQLPGGLAKLAVRMDPLDLLELRATRIEVAFTSELGLHLDLENLGLRLPVFHVGERMTVLPAFGSFTGMHPVRPAPGERIFAVADDAVRELPLQARA